MMAHHTTSRRTAKRSTSRQRAANIIRRRSEIVTYSGTLDGLLRYILSRWPYNFPWELHQVEPCHAPRIVHIHRAWLTAVMAELAQQWPDVKAALQAAGFLAPTLN